MKRFIKNLENNYIGVLILIVGVLMLIFPEQIAVVSPFFLGGGLILRGIAVVFLAVRYKDNSNEPGMAVLYCVLGSVIVILGSDAIGIIGIIWAVFSLAEVSTDINEMWKSKRCSVVHIITAVISVVLAVMLIIDPFEHFTVHVRILGLEIISSCFSKGVDAIKSGMKKRNDADVPEDQQ